MAFLAPFVLSVLLVRQIGQWLYRPEGRIGLAIWVAQATPIGASASYLVDRVTRRILPLATLFNLSLVFPDEAPSRYGIALRMGSIKRLKERTKEIESIGLGDDLGEAATRAIELVATLAKHDRLTRGHTERVRAYADVIGEELELSETDRNLLSWGVLLHDVGKLTVPSAVLNKVEKLTESEWKTLSNHPSAGGEIAAPLVGWLGDWALAITEHHERWDGKGYPLKLAGSGISLAGRITAVADAYDVITSKRSYKEAMTPEAARRELVACSGSQFDPTIVRAFLNVSLGKKWSFGPLAWLTDLPIGQLGGAVTTAPMAAVAGITVATLSAPLIQTDLPTSEPLAFVQDIEVEELAASSTPLTTLQNGTTSTLVLTSSTTALVTISTAETDIRPSSSPSATTSTTQTSTTRRRLPTTRPPVMTTTTTSTTRPAPTPAGTTTTSIVGTVPPPPITVVSSTTTTTTTSTTAGPTTTAATTPTTTSTTAAPATTTTTAAPTTTTTSTTAAPAITTTAAPATTTTTAGPTTTTAPATTTTALPAGTSVFFLHNAIAGASVTQAALSLGTEAPQNLVLPNYDTEVDTIPGLALDSTLLGIFDGEPGTALHFFLPGDGLTLSGNASLDLFVAKRTTLSLSPAIRAELIDCDTQAENCLLLSSADRNITNHINDGFESVTIDLGSINRSFGIDRVLVIRITAPGLVSMHIGFDAQTHPSALSLSLI